MFLIALWVLFFVTDDFVENDILNKKNDLQSKASFMGKIARPVFENNKVSDFQLMLEMYDLFDDPQLLPVHKIKIYRYEDETDIGKGFVYYNGTYPIKRSSIAVTPLEAIGSQGQNNKWYDWDIMGALFSYYRKLSDARVVMAPIVSKRSKFNPQYHVIKSGENTYDIRVLAPIKVNRKTVALIEVWEDYDLKNEYFSRNSLIRRLSKRLNRKLTPSDLADQMTNMSVTRLASRKDEIGLLHNNLIKLTKQIIRLFRDKEQFAADVSHELKNPIASIIAHVENNLETENNNKNSALLKIKNQALRMNKLVSDISEAAIVDHEIVAKKREKFDISNIVDEIAKHYIDEIRNSKIEINMAVQKNINFNGLPDRIAQILINLIENAISFSHPSGTINISLVRRWRKPLTLVVEDSGPGVPENMQELIFERFFTSRSGHSVVKNSSGLGLFMCREIVEAHGGKIHVETSQLGGAKFVVSL